jgi:hypothetical protein
MPGVREVGPVRYSVDPAGIQLTLIDVGADGESLRQTAATTRELGDKVAATFGTAAVVSEAFSRFWGVRDDVGERIASLVFRKAGAVSDAAHAFMDADSEMAVTALARMPAAHSTSVSGSSSGVVPGSGVGAVR